MADPDIPATPPSRDPAGPEEDARPADTAAEGLHERVERQRRHIEGLTGRDPLRGGLDD